MTFRIGKTKKLDADVERRILTGCIVSTPFLKKIQPLVELEYFDGIAAKSVMRWVLEYFGHHSKAPQKMIGDLYKDHKEGLKEEEAEWVEGFLHSISKEYERQGFNEEYLFDKTLSYFKRQRMSKNCRKILQLLEKDQLSKAEELWNKGDKIPEREDLGLNAFDPETVKKVFDQDEQRVSLTFGIDSLDKMVGPVKTGWLTVFLAPMKRGKTFALIYTAARAVELGLNTVFISLETEETDNIKRLWSSIGSLSISGETEIHFPYYKGEEVKTKKRIRPLMSKDSVRGEVLDKLDPAAGTLWLKSFPMGSAGISDIENYLDALEVFENFWPHVIIVDYIGAMAAPSSSTKGSDSEYNYNSKMLKALAQKRKAIVYSAHQTTRDALKKATLDVTQVSWDIRIFANIDIMLGLNQGDTEKDERIMRITVLGHRHRGFTSMWQSETLQQLDAGQFALEDRKIKRPTVADKKRSKDILAEEK